MYYTKVYYYYANDRIIYFSSSRMMKQFSPEGLSQDTLREETK